MGEGDFQTIRGMRRSRTLDSIIKVGESQPHNTEQIVLDRMAVKAELRAEQTKVHPDPDKIQQLEETIAELTNQIRQLAPKQREIHRYQDSEEEDGNEEEKNIVLSENFYMQLLLAPLRDVINSAQGTLYHVRNDNQVLQAFEDAKLEVKNIIRGQYKNKFEPREIDAMIEEAIPVLSEEIREQNKGQLPH